MQMREASRNPAMKEINEGQLEKGMKKAMENKTSDEGIFASCSFTDIGLHPSLCQHLKDKMGFEVPTQIQAQAIPVILSGKDVLVNAATGTGKTIVYLAPIVNLLQQRKPRVERSDGTFVLVLVPTRELCMQVHEILQKLLRCFIWIVPGYIMGGENRTKEKARLRKGISILIATPGRLLDHLKHTSSFIYTNLRWIVYDEADRILELGYGKAIEEILDFLGSRQNIATGQENKRIKPNESSRQNLLLSATLNEKVNHLANISLLNPVMIGLDDNKTSFMTTNNTVKRLLSLDSDSDGNLEHHSPLRSQAAENYNLPVQLIQRYVKVSCGSRMVLLLSILKSLFEKTGSQKIVVFLSTCDAVDFHFFLLKEFKWSSNPHQDMDQRQMFLTCSTFRLHGNMAHEDRRTAFQGFKSEKSAILLCTDIAARGLDFPKVTCIIQYDSPGEASEYVHRVGRTARLGKEGEALLFLQPAEIDYLHDLKMHGVSLTEYPLQKFLERFLFYGQKQHHQKFLSLDTHPLVILLQKALESFVLAEPKMKKLAKNAFCSWVRAYTAHRGELKKIFMLKKLHLGHVARSFGLKEQPSLVSKSLQKQAKKRKKALGKGRPSKRRQLSAI
ncbi:DEAD-box ATP-dependent RNA helicase 17 [Dendrobium catenatum]|uniref:ATP-dependent RNA helicase n=1 Tax=Dendrobium catenatum TaxID=906689 RepID=A0A2I0VXN5_9ASPA|nr:DEAD-box ATP-dependent RNA helicase 17 [Dendrobium catenatum]PKU68182.1 DEAD-box ATP-dependent RNA helicase 17 [Dendrobium catenatum]